MIVNKEEIKEAAHLKVWSILSEATKVVDQPDVYWKMEEDRQEQFKKLDIFNREVWSYIFGLIEKDTNSEVEFKNV